MVRSQLQRVTFHSCSTAHFSILVRNFANLLDHSDCFLVVLLPGITSSLCPFLLSHELCSKIYPSNFVPSPCHRFIKEVEDRNKASSYFAYCYAQQLTVHFSCYV